MWCMHRAQIVRIGDAIGFVLPEAVVERLGVAVDDTLIVVRTPIGYEFWPEDDEPPEAESV